MQIYEVVHLLNEHDPKSIGFFSSILTANSAINMLSGKPGFCEDKNGFIIIPFFIVASNTDDINEFSVYDHSKDYSFEFNERIGFFTNETDAKAAASIYKKINTNKPRDLEMELIVSKCLLDNVSWIDGFTSE